jgi:hypothetical protein
MKDRQQLLALCKELVQMERSVERSRFAAESLAFGVISGASTQRVSARAGALIA